MKNLHPLAILGINIAVSIIIVIAGVVSAPYWGASIRTLLFDFANEEIKTSGSLDYETFDKIRVVQEESAVIDVVKKVDPAVVSIIVTKDLPVIERGYDPFLNEFFSEDPFLRDFFGSRRGRQPISDNGEAQGKRRRDIGGGTGFIITSDGLVVTNKHVVFDTEADYTILMNDEKKYNAEVIARDPLNDIAILKIKPDGELVVKFPFLELGSSDSLQVGQNVVAIGNALGDFQNTVSVGVVSGLLRDIEASSVGGRVEYLEGVIQTDAAINQGNSGGPLLNLVGQVIGVNVAVASGAENIGFSIPIDSVKNTIETVKKNGKIVRPIIGVRYVMVTESLKKKNNLSVDYGAMILRGEAPDELAILPNSPAKRAGLEEYDIILEINGVKINQENPLAREILKYKVKDKIKLKVLHDGTEKFFELELIEDLATTR